MQIEQYSDAFGLSSFDQTARLLIYGYEVLEAYSALSHAVMW